MSHSAKFNERVVEIGREMFELAAERAPRMWHRAWWLERMTRLVERDEAVKTRAFQFVDCLPSLGDDRLLLGHVREYFDPRVVDLPRWIHTVVGPGPLLAARERIVSAAARFGATQMAGRFITGHDPRSAVATIVQLRAAGMAFTVDVLGESTTSYAQADRYLAQYLELIDEFARAARSWPVAATIDTDSDGPMPRVNLSIKLTSLDPHFDAIDPSRSIREVGGRLRPLFRRAREVGAFINIDMESSKYRDLTIELFKTVLMEDEFRDWTDVGIVVQAYLTDGEHDLHGLLKWARRRGRRFAIRLVKGAYWDAETAAAVRAYKKPPVWTRKWESDACYERMARTMLEHSDLIRPTFASHNVRSLAVVLATAEMLGLDKRDYELQMLYGMGDPLKAAAVAMGCCVRVYCPVGELMPGMAYLIRRLLENTSNDSFLKQGFDDRAAYDRLLADPDIVRHSTESLPRRRYADTESPRERDEDDGRGAKSATAATSEKPESTMGAFTNASSTNFADPKNREKMIGAIEYVRGELGREYPLLTDGKAATTDTWFESRNPARREEVIGKVALATPADVERAVAAARKAFGAWRSTSSAERADKLRKTADRLEMRRFELAANMILESGKPWREADADVTEAIDHCRFYADQIERIETRPRRRDLPGESNALTYRAKGVCVVISPWTFPLAILTGMTSAALAAGNTVVVKPARQAGVLAAKLVEILHDVGFPPGVVNFLPGEGATIGQCLVEHGDVNLVAFTGSHEVGTSVIEAGGKIRPGQAFIKKMIVEMGGKNAIIVDEDADLDGAVTGVIESAFSYAGQKCSSCSRAIVLDGVHDAFCNRLKEAVESIIVGPAEAPATFVGPVIDAPALERIEQYVEIGRCEGRLLVAAKLPDECDGGFYAAPTVFADVAPTARIAREEIFGPVLAILRAADFDEAIKIANATRYALTGGLYSRSPANIDRARRDFDVGNLYINRRITGSQVDAQPFGGFKLSGTGVKAGSPDYLLHFMDARCITENTLRSGLVPNEEHTEVS